VQWGDAQRGSGRGLLWSRYLVQLPGLEVEALWDAAVAPPERVHRVLRLHRWFDVADQDLRAVRSMTRQRCVQ
jgi:hypothetical protein